GLLAGGGLWEICDAWGTGRGTSDQRTQLVRRAGAFKTRVVAADPEDRAIRSILNLGHTIGHAVEAAGGYGGLRHGEAVAVGLSAALWLSVELRGLDPSVLARTEELLAAQGLPTRAPGLDLERVRDALRGDKKRSHG